MTTSTTHKIKITTAKIATDAELANFIADYCAAWNLSVNASTEISYMLITRHINGTSVKFFNNAIFPKIVARLKHIAMTIPVEYQADYANRVARLIARRESWVEQAEFLAKELDSEL